MLFDFKFQHSDSITISADHLQQAMDKFAANIKFEPCLGVVWIQDGKLQSLKNKEFKNGTTNRI